MTRKQAIAVLRSAGYHDDKRTWTRTYVENRVSFPVAQQAFADGATARENGVRCSCHECATKAATIDESMMAKWQAAEQKHYESTLPAPAQAVRS